MPGRAGWAGAAAGLVALPWAIAVVGAARDGGRPSEVQPASSSAVHAPDVDARVAGLLRQADSLARSPGETADSLRVRLVRRTGLATLLPASGRLTGRFTLGRAHPILHEIRAHRGIDIAAPLGSLVVAPADGVVRGVGFEPGYGLFVVLEHGLGVVTRYAHCSRVLVDVGERVRRRDPIALVGSSGLSTGSHLHYEVQIDGQAVDPREFVWRASAE